MVKKMKYKTLEKYDKELKEMEETLTEMEEYIEKHPEKFGTKGNYETYKYVYNIFKDDKTDFINQTNMINLILKGELIKESLDVNELSNLSKHFNETNNMTRNLLENDFSPENFLVKEISQGSYKITFAFPNPTEEDVKRTSPRKKGLLKIFDFINCGDDIERLKEEAGPDGREALLSYKEFLEEIVKNNADFTLDTEMGTVKAGLTLEQSKNICKNLNI